MRIVLGLEYDGRHFCGWQTQASGCGVQDVLEAAISKVAGHPIVVAAAGRTDTGVHALSQVVHFDTATIRPASAWVRGVNAFLPEALRVLWSSEVSEDFHARYTAERRWYQYWLMVSPVASAVLAGKVGWYHRALDISAMQSAANLMLGEHDFSAFRSSECQAKSPIKQLYQLDIQTNGSMVLFELSANAFLHHMVRNLVGSLIYVGNGKQSPNWINDLLSARDRKMAAPTFMPDGLYLTGVQYPAEFKLPETRRSIKFG